MLAIWPISNHLPTFFGEEQQMVRIPMLAFARLAGQRWLPTICQSFATYCWDLANRWWRWRPLAMLARRKIGIWVSQSVSQSASQSVIYSPIYWFIYWFIHPSITNIMLVWDVKLPNQSWLIQPSPFSAAPLLQVLLLLLLLLVLLPLLHTLYIDHRLWPI